jgi:hypothetical protein
VGWDLRQEGYEIEVRVEATATANSGLAGAENRTLSVRVTGWTVIRICASEMTKSGACVVTLPKGLLGVDSDTYKLC